MKNYFIITLAALFIFSCGKKDEIKTSKTEKDTNFFDKKVSETKPDTGNKTSENTYHGSLTNVEYGISKLPLTLKDYNGDIVAMAKWEDKLGANVLFVTETKEQGKSDARAKQLFAYHYVITDKENKLVWKINDIIQQCPVDITLSVIPNSITITDLNKNDIGESTFLYKMSCKGDVSPDDMKLMMHEGETKYAIRGTMTLEMAGEKYGGEMKVDDSFKSAPKEFLDYAKGQWRKYEKMKL